MQNTQDKEKFLHAITERVPCSMRGSLGKAPQAKHLVSSTNTLERKRKKGKEHRDQKNLTSIKTTSNMSILFKLKKSFMKQLEI